jgi:hypothetical protein
MSPAPSKKDPSRGGRPSVLKGAERVTLFLDEELIKIADAIANEQEPKVSRSAVIREVLERGLRGDKHAMGIRLAEAARQLLDEADAERKRRR